MQGLPQTYEFASDQAGVCTIGGFEHPTNYLKMNGALSTDMYIQIRRKRTYVNQVHQQCTH